MLPFPAGKGSRVVASRLSLHSVVARLRVKVLMAVSGPSKTSAKRPSVLYGKRRWRCALYGAK